GSQRFQGNPLYLQFSEGISNYFQNADNWNVANFYRLSYVKDHRRGAQFWPDSGYSYNFTLLQALPVLDSTVSFVNLFLETQAYANFDFLNHLVWANRLVGISSQGLNPQTFFLGDDVPFQSYFTTIRGFGGTTFYGSNLALWNTELRYPIATDLNFVLPPLSFLLVKDIELAGFMDTGVVSDKLGELGESKVLNSVGAGIRFYSFLFQQSLVELRFDVAWRTDEAAPPEFIFNLAPIF
ncbi:MAG TPA: BamA/TamA family outer membrane protein, partial [bacterium]|nr:BamA/TamA family outer membrane protein [bacterium]